MKNIIIIITSLFAFHYAEAQPTTYDLCPALQSVEGEWKFDNGVDEIKFYFRFKNMIAYAADFGSKRNEVFDALLGWAEHRQSGIVLQSTYANRFMTVPYNLNTLSRNDYSIMLFPSAQDGMECGGDYFGGYIHDFKHNGQSAKVHMKLINNGTQMECFINKDMMYGLESGDTVLSWPQVMFVLTKQ